MIDWLSRLSTLQLVLLIVGVVLVLLVGAGLLTRALVRRGLRTPWVVRRLNGVSERMIALVKRPLTIVVLDEVVAVIQTGRYTRNISDAIIENRAELKALAAEKLKEDPNTRLVSRIPGYDTIVDEVSETTLRVIVEMLGDPRMDELVSDLLRNNLRQIRQAVRERQQDELGMPPPADPTAPARQQEPERAAMRRTGR